MIPYLQKHQKLTSSFIAVLSCLLLVACKPSAEERTKEAHAQRLVCQDKICRDDVPPSLTWDEAQKLSLFKNNNIYFTIPSEYGRPDIGPFGFRWPSKSPRVSNHIPPEKHDKYANIDIFLRSYNLPPPPRGYELIQYAEKNDWILSRKTLRKGLDQVVFKHVIFPHNQHYMDDSTYYIATLLKTPDGLPPVAICNHQNPDFGGGFAFMWRDGIQAGVHISQNKCQDFPEIYQEATRVLNLIKKVSP